MRYPRIAESPYLRSALRSADPATAVLGVYNRMYHLLHYGDPEAEYEALVERVTLWDVACERQVEIRGPDAFRFVQRLVPRDLSTCEVGQAKYCFLTNADGGIIADPVLLRLDKDRFWLSTSDADVDLWCKGLAVNSDLEVEISTPDVAPVQIQGPLAKDLMVDLFGSVILDLGYYRLSEASYDGVEMLVSRTGWSTELGYEVYVPDATERAAWWWDVVLAAGERYGVRPIGPNQVRRIEAGILAHGADIDESMNPFEADLGYAWMIDLDQPTDFVGKAALRKIRDTGPTRRLVGVDLDGPPLGTYVDGVMSRPLPVSDAGDVVGKITSACWSPRLAKNIGFALVPTALAEIGTQLAVLHQDLASQDPVHLTAVVVPKPHWDPQRTTARG